MLVASLRADDAQDIGVANRHSCSQPGLARRIQECDTSRADLTRRPAIPTVEGARRPWFSLASDPADAREAVDAIERTAAQALGEMRRLLAVLRMDEDATLAPQASLDQLGALAGEVRGAGLPVEVRVEGRPRRLAPGLDASAYRIAQEALTNALKHAGRARATVVVRYGADALELEVADDGVGAPAGGGEGGHGLIGMRERAALFGGTVAAGPADGGGYAGACAPPIQEAAT